MNPSGLNGNMGQKNSVLPGSLFQTSGMIKL